MTDEVFIPKPEHRDEAAEERMRMGKPGHELHDPWFDTDEGKAWLAEQGEG